VSWVVVFVMFAAGVACLVVAAGGTSPQSVWNSLYSAVTGGSSPASGSGPSTSTGSGSGASTSTGPSSGSTSAASTPAAIAQRAATDAQRSQST
jgi:hypothetical protein